MNWDEKAVEAAKKKKRNFNRKSNRIREKIKKKMERSIENKQSVEKFQQMRTIESALKMQERLKNAVERKNENKFFERKERELKNKTRSVAHAEKRIISKKIQVYKIFVKEKNRRKS